MKDLRPRRACQSEQTVLDMSVISLSVYQAASFVPLPLSGIRCD